MAGVTFLPIQQGTGDPSPTNVRPISPGLTITGIGNIYGGYLDMAHGTVVETWATHQCTGEETISEWTLYGSTNNFAGILNGTIARAKYQDGACNAICDMLPAVSNVQMYYATKTQGVCVYNGERVVAQVDGITTMSGLQEWLGENTPTLCYLRKTPAVHALTSSQLAEAMQQLNVHPASMLERRRRLIMAQPHLATATPANPVAFSATLAAPLKGLECAFAPVQAAGTPAPDNVLPISGWTGANVVRTGKNLFDPADTTFKKWQLMSGVFKTRSDTYDQISISRNGDTLTVITSGTYMGIAFEVAAASYARTVSASSGSALLLYDAYADGATMIDASDSQVLTIPANTAGYIAIRYNATGTYTLTIQIETGSTATSYAPYTGQTLAVQFPAMKNLFDIGKLAPFNSNVTLTKSGGDFTITNNNGYAVGIFRDASGDIVFPVTDGKYTMSISEPTTVGVGIYASTDGENYSWFNNGILTGNTSATFTVSGQKYIKLVSSVGSGKTATVKGSQLELGSTATPYEPYGTIYGGYIDPVRGVARAEWGAVDLGSLSWSYEQSSTRFYTTSLATKMKMPTSGWGDEFFVQCYKPSIGTANNYTASVNSNTAFYIKDTNYTDPGTFKSSVSGMMLVYQLATPIDYPLTPAQLKTLKGANVIFTDLNGNVSPTFWTN